VFVAGVLLVLGSLGWATFHALRLERLEAEARAQAHYQESIRLALWRMDARITPIIAREAARPYFQYRPFYPADRAYTRMLSPVEKGEFLVPSPLLQATDPYLKLHFERGTDGVLSSPQVPTGEMRTLAESVYVTGYAVVSSEQLLTQLDDLLSPASRRKFAFTGGAPEPGAPAQPAPQRDQSLSGDGDALNKAFDDLQKEQSQVQTGQTGQSLNQPTYRQQIKQSAEEYQNRASNAQMAQQPAPQYAARGPMKSVPPQSAAPATAPASPPADPAPAPQTATVEDKKPATLSPASSVSSQTGKTEKDVDKEVRRAEVEKAAEGARDDGPLDEAGGRKKDQALEDFAKTRSYVQGYADGTGLVGALEEGVVQGQFAPAWVLGIGDAGRAGADELVYTRVVDAGSTHLTQGFWVDWPALRDALLTDARDLLPGATLRPLPNAPDPADEAVLGRTLAALPAVLDAPLPKMPAMPVWSPVRSTLLATWIAALGAMIAIALVLRASMELAERRGRFVSAVTHELRTPLTTFCLYSQMLADGMVRSEDDKKTYFKTLSSESQRLARIVESVLEYARLGRRQGNEKARVAASELVEKIVPSLKQRCDQAGMELVVEGEADSAAEVAADPATLERVLFNLVDNACKYASGGEDKRVHLLVQTGGRDLVISVRDHGPGLERAEQKRVFRPFVRGHRQSDGSIPGLGLGLALSQGLARELHGELRAVARDDGAEFALRVPLA
jgi:signal transduction histidine kinase/Tfp pilus assembly protein PilV